jgi:hypothetical protein
MLLGDEKDSSYILTPLIISTVSTLDTKMRGA